MNYFTATTDPAIDFTKVDATGLAMLEQARDFAGIPFEITSHYRTPEHSVAVGGLNNDAHTAEPCSAFDIKYTNVMQRAVIIYSCAKAGFRRIGINEVNSHVHVDNDDNLPYPALWIEQLKVQSA